MAANAALDAKTAALEEALKSQAAAERRCGQLDAQQTQIAATLRDARDEIQVLQEEAAALGAEHAETTARAARLEGSCQLAAGKVGALEAAARAADAQRRKLAVDRDSLAAQLAGVREQLVGCESDIRQANEQLALKVQEASPLHTNRSIHLKPHEPQFFGGFCAILLYNALTK